jgi:hypothetical protein
MKSFRLKRYKNSKFLYLFCMKCVFSTNMSFFIINDACITSITVDIFSIISDTTKSTFITMEIISFDSIIKEITYFTEISGEFYLTGYAFITDWLLGITFGADDFFNVKPIYFMGWLVLIMTKATCIYFITTRWYKLTVAKVMRTLFH